MFDLFVPVLKKNHQGRYVSSLTFVSVDMTLYQRQLRGSILH